MQKKLLLALITLCHMQLLPAQNDKTVTDKKKDVGDAAYTFTESQLGENENVSSNVTIINSNTNIYASEIGFLFSPVRFRYRALNQKYNDIYINGAPMNDMESGQFRYSVVGGLNQQTRNTDYALPFESNGFAMPGMAGANNYNFRPASMSAGHRLTLSGANRNYILRGVYAYNSGLNNKGWAYSGNLTYRWANEGYVEGTFYNAVSYFLGVQKVFGENNSHSLSLMTWGNPTERASQGASTDEMYWLANDRMYNPYWGYQNGKKRNSRVVHDFAPSVLLTWDWDINEQQKLITSLSGKYSMYSSTKLNYSNSDNPQPDYYKKLPSNFYDVWNEDHTQNRGEQNLADWQFVHDFYKASKVNRQINWDQLYYANKQAAAQGQDAMYYLQARNNDVLSLSLSSTLNIRPENNTLWNLGYMLAASRGRHYQTIEDLLGANSFHNVNNYAIGTYTPESDQVQYDLNNPNAKVGVGDVYGYDYYLNINKATAWTSFAKDFGVMHAMMAGKIGGTWMQREGRMKNGLFANNSYGKSKVAQFLDGGLKSALTFNLGRSNTLGIGLGYQWNAPIGNAAFISPEMSNDFVSNLKNEQIFSADLGWQFKSPWVDANINAYYNMINHLTEWQCFYFDDINSFSYVSITGAAKAHYGVEMGVNFKLSSAFGVKLIGTMSEAKYTKNSDVTYINSTEGTVNTDVLYNKGMREGGTPLTAGSVILSYHQGGWFLDLKGNYYDRIYLYYSPYYNYKSVLEKRGLVDEQGNPRTVPQSKGRGGFMLDGSIGKSIYLKKGSLSINLMANNLLNNTNIVTGGYEQSRSDFTASGNARTYQFSKNPKKYYVYGINAMLNIAYKF